MEEKTKELKNLEELENENHEDFTTKKIETISEEEIINGSESNEELTTQVIKKDELSPTKNKKGKKSKKQLWLIIIASTIVLIIFLLIFLLKQKKEEPPKTKTIKYTEYGSAISKSLEKGLLDRIIKENLEKNKIKIGTVTLLNIDIDSDGRQDLVVYASESNNKVLINLNVKKDVSYEESYKLDSKESFGYLFSDQDEKFYWYVEENKKFTPIDRHSTAKDIEENKEKLEYLLITTKYKNTNIIEYGLKYNFDKKLDIKELEEKAITNKDIQDDIKITQNDAKKKIKEERETIEKKKEEEAEKIKQERLEKFKKDFTLETAKKVLQVALMNYEADDTRNDEGKPDSSRFHDSTYAGEFNITVENEGEWEVVDNNQLFWVGKNIKFNTRTGQIIVSFCEIGISDSEYKIKEIKFEDYNGSHEVIFEAKDDINIKQYISVPKSLIK